MKNLNQFITEYIIKKKLDKPIDSEHNYDYYPKTEKELRKNIQELLDANIYDLNCIDTSKITDMASLFNSDNYNKTLDNIDISKWDVSNVTNMENMFFNYVNFNCDLSKWDVSNVKDMKYMFYNCGNFDCDLSNWDVSNVETMTEMFYYCKKFNCDLNKWDVSKVKNTDDMFWYCHNLKNKPSWYKE